MATFQADEFSGSTLAGCWTVSGTGTVTLSGDGFLNAALDTSQNNTIYQNDITGPFDLIARLKCAFYPAIIPDATYQCQFKVYIGPMDYLYGLQNRKGGSSTQNEFYISRHRSVWYEGEWVETVRTLNPACDPMPYMCIRISRDSAADFHIYYNTAHDATGTWVELSQTGYFLNSSAPVQIGIYATTSAPKTFQVDYIISSTSLKIEGWQSLAHKSANYVE